MTRLDRQALLSAGAAGLDGDAHEFLVAADHHLSLGDEASALIALDRAYGLSPTNPTLVDMRAALLDRFAVVEHDLVFRYVPAGTFLMGSTTGDPDERPVHPVTLEEYWVAEIPMTWSAFCQLAGWSPPPDSQPLDEQDPAFGLHQNNAFRRKYCATETGQALAYNRKPMITVGLADAEALARKLSNERVEYALPSEAEWEKAARGGLIGKRYSWGDAPPTPARCDFNHFGDFRLADPRSFPPNGYGLFGMCGGVAEWTSTCYDALAYAGAESSAAEAPDGQLHRVLRGGSWADAAAAVTVSFRRTGVGSGWQYAWGDSFNPNVGFRLVRRVRHG